MQLLVVEKILEKWSLMVFEDWDESCFGDSFVHQTIPLGFKQRPNKIDMAWGILRFWSNPDEL